MRKFAHINPLYTFVFIVKSYLRILLLLLISTLLPSALRAQGNAYEQYIKQYADMAVDQMQRYGIPASITLAQGLLESGAGKSKLAREGNNHFGIKVGTTWSGPYMIVADDRPDDKFRVYRSPSESYEDHSLFLRNGRRYASLFDLKATDYKGWAHGLKRAGYATNPVYAQSLINLIERYDLHCYDKRQHLSREEQREQKVEAQMQKSLSDHPIRRCNGQYYVLAQAGDTYASIGRKLKVKEEKLRQYNDVDDTYQLQPGDAVYLGKKRKKADASMERSYHVMEAGESLYSISQRYGIRLKSLCRMNPIRKNYRFKVGDEIKIK